MKKCKYFQFYKIGSDPELALAEETRTELVHVPATTLLGGRPGPALTAMIGRDGDSSTVELRPYPAASVSRHWYSMAQCLTTLATHANARKLYLVAAPYWSGRPFGAHIHVSGFITDPFVEEHRVCADPDGDCFRLSDNEWGAIPPHLAALFPQHRERARQGQAFSVNYLLLPLMYFLVPWERAIQPPLLRDARLGRYGAVHAWRGSKKSRPPANSTRGLYWHLEYRMPSTWLVHPALAFTYLALSKLALLNLDAVNALVAGGLASPVEPDECWRVLNERVREHDWTRMSDMGSLERALAVCRTLAPTWAASSYRVDVAAWSDMLNEEEPQ